MYTRILVPLDGSPLSENVIPLARVLAGALGLPVHLVRAFESPPIDIVSPRRGVYLDRLLAASHSTATDDLERAAAPLKKAGISVSTAAREGDPATKIVEEATTDPGTLILMATHGRTGVARWTMGSVTNRVLRAAACPVLAIRPPETEEKETDQSASFHLRTVILPLDGSREGEQAIPHAVAVAKALKLNIVPVRAIPAETEFYRYSHHADDLPPELIESLDAEAGEYLRGVGRRLEAESATVGQAMVLRGSPARAISELAREAPGAMIVMTTHGRSGVGRWVLGSVADSVVRGTGAPVLMVRVSGK